MTPFVMTLGDRRYTDADLTGSHLATVTLLVGEDDWAAIDPHAGPVRTMALLASFIAHDPADGRDLVAAREAVAGMTAAELRGVLAPRK